MIAATYDAKGAAPDRTRPVMVPKVVDRNDKTKLPTSLAINVGEVQVDRPAADGLRSEVGMTSGSRYPDTPLRSEVGMIPESRHSNTSLRSEVNSTDRRLEFEKKWKVEGIVSERVKRKLDRCKSLLFNKYPNGVDYDVLFDELTEMFLDRADPERRIERRKKRQERQKKKPAYEKTRNNSDGRTPSAATTEVQSRYIPPSVREKVWIRDGGSCTFVGANGRPCNSTHNLQFDHHPIPFGRGGPSTVENLRLLCARHNQYTAEQVYGRGYTERFYQRRKRLIVTAISRTADS